ARPTADIEHDLVRAAPSPFQKGLGEGFELAVVSVSVGDEVRGFGSVPRLRLSFICWHWHLADVRAGHIMSPRHICLISRTASRRAMVVSVTTSPLLSPRARRRMTNALAGSVTTSRAG